MLQDIDGQEGIQTFVSDQWSKITGYSKEELLGSCFFDLIDPKDRVASIERHRLKMAGKAVPGLYEMDIIRKDSRLGPIELTGSFTTYQDKRANVLYIRDTADRVQAEEELKHYQEHLEEIVCQRTTQLSHEIKRREQAELKLERLYKKEQKLYQQVKKQLNDRVEFTRALVHELKTPLTPMVAASSAMVSGIQEEPWKSMAEQVHKGANNLNRRIGSLLDLSKSELGLLHLNFETVNPALLLYDLHEYFSPEAARLGLSLVLDIPEQLPSIWADPERLRQVVINLLDNALKFTPKQGQIKISAGVRNSDLEISVQDTGIGMTLKEQRKIFSPYERSEHDRNRLSGLGLGLALAKTFVEQHGGKIWIQSQKGRGSTFTFSIPLKRNLKQVIKK
jgi:PAS domain S-box-containing protein